MHQIQYGRFVLVEYVNTAILDGVTGQVQRQLLQNYLHLEIPMPAVMYGLYRGEYHEKMTLEVNVHLLRDHPHIPF